VTAQPFPVLDLFAGYGGFSLAFEAVGLPGAPVFHSIGFAEIEPYVSAVLAHRFPGRPNFGAVQHITRDRVRAECGRLPVVITGGFPCQPHSTAGGRLSVEDERDLWDECCRLLRDLRPGVALFENVDGLLSSESFTDAANGELGEGLFFNRVCSDLASIGYAALWQIVSAADVGAPHRRKRIWLLCLDERRLADRDGARLQRRILARGDDAEGREEPGDGHARSGGEHRPRLADPDRQRGNEDPQPGELRPAGTEQSSGDRRAADPAEGTEDPRRRWPAALGRWPARPGEPQHPWEPARIVGDTNRGESRHPPAAGGNGAGPDGGTWRGEPAGSGLALALGAVEGGEAESDLGGNADGSADRLDPAPVSIREVEDDFTFTDERLPQDPSSLHRLSAEELVELAAADEGQEAEGDAVNRIPRLKAVGNGIVPVVAYPFAQAIADLLEQYPILATESPDP
jgi:DNA-cytosine methyltransferase